jgi:hypothetical protein
MGVWVSQEEWPWRSVLFGYSFRNGLTFCCLYLLVRIFPVANPIRSIGRSEHLGSRARYGTRGSLLLQRLLKKYIRRVGRIGFLLHGPGLIRCSLISLFTAEKQRSRDRKSRDEGGFKVKLATILLLLIYIPLNT